MKLFKYISICILSFLFIESSAQGVGFPKKTWGIGYGNSPEFDGLRFNFIDTDISTINGINVTVWFRRDYENHTGTFNGIGLGVPMAAGTAYRNGLSIGIFGVGAGKRLT